MAPSAAAPAHEVCLPNPFLAPTLFSASLSRAEAVCFLYSPCPEHLGCKGEQKLGADCGGALLAGGLDHHKEHTLNTVSSSPMLHSGPRHYLALLAGSVWGWQM